MQCVLYWTTFIPGINTIWWLCLVPSSTTRLASDVGYRTMTYTSLTENKKHNIPSQSLKTMMTSSNGNIFRVTDHLCGEFTGPGDFPTQRPVTRSFDVYFDLRPNKWLSKQSWGWWFGTLSCSLWRHRNAILDCLPRSFFRPLYVWFPVHL